MEYFWTNTVWFLLLGMATIIEIIFVLVKSRNRARVFAFTCRYAEPPFYLK